MPKELTHWIVAEQTAANLPEGSRLSLIISGHHEMYLAGAVLPDTLLHLFSGPYAPVALALADSFHDSNDNSYNPLIRVNEQFPEGLPPNILACLLGVISHIQADIVFHPFVYAVTGTNDMGSHYRMETMIDVCLLQSGAIPPVRHLSELFIPQVREHLIEVLSLLFDPENKLPVDVVSRSLHLHCHYQAMYDNLFWQTAAPILGSLPIHRFRRQQHLFYPLNLFGKKYELENEGKWCCPVTGNQRQETLKDLVTTVVQRTQILFGLIKKYDSLKTALTVEPGENLLTGLYGITKSAMRRPVDLL